MTNPAVVESNKIPRISFAMLCGSGSVKCDTMLSLVQSMQFLASKGIEHDLIMLQGVTGVDSARNIITDIFMQRDYTHIMMIDDDMAWAADLPYRMLQENLPILGVPYKRKNINNCRWTVNHPIPEVALMAGKPYLMRVDSIGTGMMLVNRHVFDTLRPLTETAIISDQRPPVPLYFRHTISSNGKLKSEDFSFCEKVRLQGIDIWAWVDEEIAHIGNYAYTGRYSDIVGTNMRYEGQRLPLRVMLE